MKTTLIVIGLCLLASWGLRKLSKVKILTWEEWEDEDDN